MHRTLQDLQLGIVVFAGIHFRREVRLPTVLLVTLSLVIEIVVSSYLAIADNVDRGESGYDILSEQTARIERTNHGMLCSAMRSQGPLKDSSTDIQHHAPH